MNNRISLYQLERPLRIFLFAFILVLTTAVLTGIIYLYNKTSLTPKGAVVHYNGDEVKGDEEIDIPENYPKPVNELLLTTHNHLFGFSFIFLSLGGIFYFSSVVRGFWKTFLMTEPLFSTIITWGSLWLMRFVHPGFVWLTAISSTILYLSFFIMVTLLSYELLFKKERA
ncbi:MAG: hypothetical protein HUU43_07395 [Ignavibacteriaceae bacterium]|nr:hypothetical protein [Ignavibacteriaceae bacterium]NUM70656.1 hypothetical protein [Ignavibacteriaceae bacterium]